MEQNKTIWKKTFSYVGKFIGSSTIFGKIYTIGKKIYYTGKKIYSKTKNTFNFAKNTYGYIKDRISGKDPSYYKNQLRKNWKKSFLSDINYKKYVNKKSFDKINDAYNGYKRAKEYYNIIERYKNKIKSSIFKYNNMKNQFQNLLQNLRNKTQQKKEYIRLVKQYQNYTVKITQPVKRREKCKVCKSYHINEYLEEQIFINKELYEKYNEYINKIKNCENEFELKVKDIDSFKCSIKNKEEEIKKIISEFKGNLFSFKNYINSSENEIIDLGKNLNISYLIRDFNNMINEFISYNIN